MMRKWNVSVRDEVAREKAVRWCKEHGVDPARVPLTGYVEVLDEQHLELETYDTTAAGQIMWDERKQEPKMRWLHVKYTRPIPEELLDD